ncbi:HNH endonuclease [Nocardia sp. NPDC004260]
MSQKRDMPSMNAIADHWRNAVPEWLERKVLDSHPNAWHWPFCFGCGWFAPVTGRRRDSWIRANGWLDRAHLADRARGGPDTPSNLVPLCHLCHDVMPSFDERAVALEWVRMRPRCEPLWQCHTDDRFDSSYPPNRHTTLIRARARYLETQANIAEILAAATETGPPLTAQRFAQLAQWIGGPERLEHAIGRDFWPVIAAQIAA